MSTQAKAPATTSVQRFFLYQLLFQSEIVLKAHYSRTRDALEKKKLITSDWSRSIIYELTEAGRVIAKKEHDEYLQRRRTHQKESTC